MTGLERYVGQVLDNKYRLEWLLGQGGMGAVYLATHLGTERYVALKLIAPQFMRNEEFVERFKREARAAGRLRHPNVVDVTDFGFAHVGAERVAYLVMEYLDGCTLGDVLAEEKRLPLEWVVDILEQVCSAVHEAHQQGIVHRDLKPDNIWLEPNRLGSYRIKVLDFGIAKLAEISPTGAQTINAAATETGLSEPGSTTSAQGEAGRSTIAKNVPTDLNTDTLIYPSSHSVGPSPDHLPSQHDEAITQNFFDSSRAGVGDGNNAQGTMAVQAAVEADHTQLFATPAKENKQLSSAALGAQKTQAVEDADKTLIFDDQMRGPMAGKTTARGPSAAQTVSASATVAASGLTRVGAIMGTPLYMSPEQCRSAHLDARSDIYSLGVIAYQMLAGDPPFTGNTAAVMSDHLDSAPPPLHERTRKVSKRAAKMVMSALAKDPADRPQTALAFANSLRAQADGIGSLYRRAFALYSEYFPKFLRLSLIAHIPVIVFTLLTIGLTLSERSLRSHGMVANVLTIAAIVVLGLLQIAAYFVAASAISGMTAVIVTQISVAPLRPVQLRTAFAVLKRRWRPFLNTSIRLTLRIMLGYVLLFIPGLVMSVRYALWAPVVLMEGLSKKAALRRARELAARSWRTIIIVSVLQVLIPITASALLGRLTFKVDKGSPTSHSVSVKRSVSQQLTGLVNILIVPLMSIVPALLYLKMRQLGGETLGTALEQIEEVETERRQWQQRMRSRLNVTAPSGQTPHSGA